MQPPIFFRICRPGVHGVRSKYKSVAFGNAYLIWGHVEHRSITQRHYADQRRLFVVPINRHMVSMVRLTVTWPKRANKTPVRRATRVLGQEAGFKFQTCVRKHSVKPPRIVKSLSPCIAKRRLGMPLRHLPH